jgi:hypothetical protein
MKYIKFRMEETGIMRSSAAIARKLLKLWPYTVTVFHDEAWFHLYRHVSSKNNLSWSSVSLHLIHRVALCDIKIGMWYTVSAKQIIEPVCYAETINSDRCVGHIDRILHTARRRGTVVCVLLTGFSICPHRRRFSRAFARGVW